MLEGKSTPLNMAANTNHTTLLKNQSAKKISPLRYKRSKTFWLDQRGCAVRPKKPDFGYSGADFPRAYARIPKPVSTGVENDFFSAYALFTLSQGSEPLEGPGFDYHRRKRFFPFFFRLFLFCCFLKTYFHFLTDLK